MKSKKIKNLRFWKSVHDKFSTWHVGYSRYLDGYSRYLELFTGSTLWKKFSFVVQNFKFLILRKNNVDFYIYKRNALSKLSKVVKALCTACVILADCLLPFRLRKLKSTIHHQRKGLKGFWEKTFPWVKGSKLPLNFSTSPTRAEATQNKKFYSVVTQLSFT